MRAILVWLTNVRKPKRAQSFAEARDKLSTLEWLNVRFVRWTFNSPTCSALMTWAQRIIGAGWVHHCTKNIRQVHGLERIEDVLRGQESAIFVSNHRSFFDMYVINTVLYRAGFNQRMLFPVRSKFFYDHPLGFFVNLIMSWFSMYPPVFRDRKKAVLNHVAFTELAQDLSGGRSVGLHPEGTRNLGDDPYTFLPAQSGIGRLIQLAGVKVVPIFINGLGNDLKRQVTGNFDGTGDTVIVVFGEPVDFGQMLSEDAGPKVYKAIAEQTMLKVAELGQEEKAHRAALGETQNV